VSAFVAVLDKDLSNRTKTSEVDLEPLLRNSYSSLFAAEAGRRLKSVPVAFYQQPPAKLFDASCLAAFAGWDVGQF
jgi:U3 small nucleolar RNA-associated protein 19